VASFLVEDGYGRFLSRTNNSVAPTIDPTNNARHTIASPASNRIAKTATAQEPAMIHNAMTIDREASAVFAGAIEDGVGSAAGSCLVALGGCLDRAEPKMNDRIKRLFIASSPKLNAKEVQRDQAGTKAAVAVSVP
jgi:hypothetical protein